MSPVDKDLSVSTVRRATPPPPRVVALDRGAAAAAEDFTENQASLLRTIRGVRKDSSLCDVQFLVGKDPESRKAFSANSTILALRSTYFKVKKSCTRARKWRVKKVEF